MKTALVAIAKDEGPYIREWVLYHKKVCGFDEILVYENDSTDETREELERMATEGLCEWKHWPRSKHNPPQQTAYGDAIARMGDKDWLCLLDLDEFLVINTGESLWDFLGRFGNDVGSVSFNWAMFYSLDKKMSSEPVTKRVRFCYGDPHVKTIARCRAVAGFGIHTFNLKPEFRYMHCSGVEYKIEDSDLPMDAKICTVKSNQILDWRVAQVNHYMMKSEEEVKAKDERGRATTKRYVRKNIMEFYRNATRQSTHKENQSIARYIDSRLGARVFYEETKKWKIG